MSGRILAKSLVPEPKTSLKCSITSLVSGTKLTSKSEKNGHVLGLEKSFFLSPLHHDVYSCSRASLLPFRVVNHGGLTLYSAGPLSSYDSTKDTASTALGTVAAPSARLNPPSDERALPRRSRAVHPELHRMPQIFLIEFIEYHLINIE